MAGTTTTTANDIINATVIADVMLDYEYDQQVVDQFTRKFSLEGRPGNTLQLAILDSLLGTPSDGGASVDTEFNAAEDTALTDTARSTSAATISVSEYGLMVSITDNVMEDAMNAAAFVEVVVADSARALQQAFEDDLCSILGSFSNTGGSSGVNLALSDLNAAIVTVRNAGVRADGLVAVLDHAAASDFEDAITATSTSQAVFNSTASDWIGASRDPSNGLMGGTIGIYKSMLIVTTGLMDSANMGADNESAVFVPHSEASPGFAALGTVTKRSFRVERQREAAERHDAYVATMRKGGALIKDAAGVTLVTDA